MSSTRGEGRSGAEKSQRVVVPYAERKAARDRRLAEEADWAARSGEVTTVRNPLIEEMERRRAEDGKHWLVFGMVNLFGSSTPRVAITGCACGFEADVDSDCGYGDSVVLHLLSVGAERVDRG